MVYSPFLVVFDYFTSPYRFRSSLRLLLTLALSSTLVYCAVFPCEPQYVEVVQEVEQDEQDLEEAKFQPKPLHFVAVLTALVSSYLMYRVYKHFNP